MAAPTAPPAPATYLDLINLVDNVPLDFNFYAMWKLYLPTDSRPHGFLTDDSAARLPWTASFRLEPSTKEIFLLVPPEGIPLAQYVNQSFQEVIDAAIAGDIFPSVHGMHSEPFRILGFSEFVHLERFTAPLFGIASNGAHMTAYVREPHPDNSLGTEGRALQEAGAIGNGHIAATDLKIWIPRRAKHLYTYPSMLDTTVAGGIKAGDTPFGCILAESDEEASLPVDLVREQARSVGVLTYVSHSSRTDCTVPVVLYVFDLELPVGVAPAPKDDEVEAFTLMTVEEVKRAMFAGEFKPNCNLVMIDFFMRHGIITPENERDYVELATRLHRRLPVPIA